jgi:hypothetical protein
MNKPILKIPEPKNLCAECFEESPEIFNDKYVFCYCEHNQAAAIYNIQEKLWHIYTPMSAEKFKQMQQGIIRDEKRYQAISDMGQNHFFH